MKVPESWIGTERDFRLALEACNRADKDFVPLYIKNNSDVRKLLYEVRKYKEEKK